MVWQGEVEVFDLRGHPQASRCYAWAIQDHKRTENFTAVLGRAGVDSAQAAVRAALLAKPMELRHSAKS
jgi:hypothetical protein